MGSLGIYVHVPFCVKKCNYCDFLSFPLKRETDCSEVENYVNALQKEICNPFKMPESPAEVDTIYLGGGTPSLLSGRQIGTILETIRRKFSVKSDAEITMECNPGTVTAESLRAFRDLGINRLSIGIQSAVEKELSLLGRIHTFSQAKQAVFWAREAGFTNLSVDLMSAVPGQTIASYEHSLRKILALEPQHISSYSLIIEEGTPFFEKYSDNPPVDEDTDRKMYELTQQMLADRGYARYEISNYAKPGKECRHNLGYWDRTEYLGIGAGSSSLIKGERFDHIRDRKAYIEKIRNGESILIDREILSVESQMEEFMYLGLRKVEGVSRTDFQNCFGKNANDVYGKILDKLEEEQLLEFSGDRIRLTHRGMDVSNCVLAEFLF